MAVYSHNLIINQGADFTKNFTIEDASTNSPKSLVGYAVSAQLRKTPTSSSKHTFISTVTSDSGGNVRISLGATETSAIKSGRYVYDVVINSGIDTVSGISTTLRVVQGSAIVNPGITR
jgi:hypothetical protein|tara:strand:- start:4613 stop:4969 length:357 start_codon:yes stop_codon:yes gene_type:complete